MYPPISIVVDLMHYIGIRTALNNENANTYGIFGYKRPYHERLKLRKLTAEFIKTNQFTKKQL